MPKHKTVASMLVTMRHAEVKLGTRATSDATGAKLVHDVRNLLLVLEDAERDVPEGDELLEIANASAELNERVNDYLLGRERVERVAVRLPSDPVLSDDDIARAHEAHEGPVADTMARCPACAGCILCGDRRLVSIRDAVDWRTRNAPKGS